MATYSFTDEWRINGSAADIYGLLSCPRDYPDWWGDAFLEGVEDHAGDAVHDRQAAGHRLAGRADAGQHRTAGQAGGLDRGAGVGAEDLGRVIGELGVGDDLDALEGRAVVELDEREGLGVAAGADPALEENGLAGGGGFVNFFDKGALHGGLVTG